MNTLETNQTNSDDEISKLKFDALTMNLCPLDLSRFVFSITKDRQTVHDILEYEPSLNQD